MRSGLLTEIIEIQRPTTTKNEVGERITVYASIYTTKARIVQTKGEATIDAEEKFNGQSLTMEVWHYVDIQDIDQILWNGKSYRIIDIWLDKVQHKKVIKLEKNNE